MKKTGQDELMELKDSVKPAEAAEQAGNAVPMEAAEQTCNAAPAEDRDAVILAVEGLDVFEDEMNIALVKDVSIEVRRGESIGIVGESGSGKTLTLKSLIGLLPEGVHEESVSRLENPHVAMIFQNPVKALDPLCPVGKQLEEVYMRHHGENVDVVSTAGEINPSAQISNIEEKRSFMSKLAGIFLPPQRQSKVKYQEPRSRSLEKEARAWAKATCERLSLPEEVLDEDRYPRSLSGGQCQRIGIAMALACEPEVLLCDEPTTALDVTVQKQTIGLLKELQKEHGFAIVFVTHNLAVASEVCDRLMVMKDGRIVETETPAEMLHDPKDPYTKMLVAAILNVPEREKA